MKNTLLFSILLHTLAIFSQGDATINESYPVSYFSKPLEIPLVLSGTFAELRSDHFHAGLDIKTQQREGLRVFSTAPGYVSRIKISPWGYGKAIYITHPNGYTTVYAHLKKFSKKIESYIKKIQYKKESFEIQVFPKFEELPVKKNEIIAFSGSTGGFVGPHLHYEIRDTKTEKPINPFLFGIDISDSKKPRINTLMGYPIGSESHINKINKPLQLNFIKLKNGTFLANKIKAYGTIGFGINAFDQLDGAYNKNGLYSLQMRVNGKVVHEFKATSFSFAESKLINLLIDYERFETLKQRVQKTYIVPANKLSLYAKNNHNGIVKIEDGISYNIEITAKDFKGNSQKIVIPVIGKKEAPIIKRSVEKTPYYIESVKFNKFKEKGIQVAFPKNTFYSNFYLDFVVKDSFAIVHKPVIPLNKKYTLTFDVSNYSNEDKEHMYIAYINKNNKASYQKTVKKDTTFYTLTKKLGKFSLLKDINKPEITLKNFKNGQWLTHAKTLKVKIIDKESGIKSYRGEIDGEWILMEYNVKNNTLTYNFSDKKFDTAKHNFKIEVIDNVGNLNTLNASFYRKK